MVRKTEVGQLSVDQQIANEVERQVDLQRPSIVPQYDNDDDDFSVGNVLAELGTGYDDAKVNVYLMEPGKPGAFVDSFAPNDFSLEMLKQTYGAGTYKIQIRAGGRIIPGGRVVRIAKSLNSGTVSVPQFAPDKLIETMNIGFERLGSMFAQAIQSLAANQPKLKTTVETLEELRLMREIMGGNVQPAPAQNSMDLLNLAAELAGKMNPGPQDENTVLLEGIKQFGPLLQTLMAGQPAHNGGPGLNGQQRVLPQPHSQPMAAPVPAPAPVPSLSPSPQGADMNMLIDMYLKTLLANARADNDPMTYAQTTIDYMGDEEAVKLATNPQWFDLLCQRIPDAAAHKEWFEELRTGILYLTKPEEVDKQNETGLSVELPNATNPISPGS